TLSETDKKEVNRYRYLRRYFFYKNAAENCELPHKIINSPDTASFPVQIFFKPGKKFRQQSVDKYNTLIE
ncbi:hypothetical protein, partial [Thiolapillus sp.]|uniref:hypothetical protein n=1 Tax=Thiolapillus sp. TaxID=2017437 RepID=UPI003AF63AD0